MANKLTPTPKVAAAVLGGIIASAILANVTLITPDLFEGLGKWSGLVYGLTITLVMGAAGWLKSEGDNAAGSDQTAPAETPAAKVTVSDTNAAPAATFPAAKVEAAQASALAAVEPAPVAPVFEAPATVVETPVAP